MGSEREGFSGQPAPRDASRASEAGVVDSSQPEQRKFDHVLRIARIETIPIRVPLSQVYRGSGYAMSHRATIITRVHTDVGIVGEAYAGDENAGLADIVSIIEREIAPQLVGEDAFAIERCWQLARVATRDILRDRRLGLVATACVDAACWDAVGKSLGVPLWRLWGGTSDVVPAICIGGYYGLDIAEEVTRAEELGFAGMKFKVGGCSAEEDAQRFARAREIAGPEFILMADANQAWSPEEAIRFARLVVDLNLHWFEEPCEWHNDRRAMREVRHMTGARICAGQSELSAAGCRELMTLGAIDVCNFDSSWSGGPTEWRRVAALATTFDVRMGHHEEPQVASHLLASIPHSTFVESFQSERDPIWWNLVTNRPELIDGTMRLADRPGFGWELDGDFLDAHRVDRRH